MSCTLGKDERLKSRKQIELLFAGGKSFSLPPFRVYYSVENNNDIASLGNLQKSSLRMGVGVSSRHFKRATDRNRMKRLIRESWRIQKNELNEMLKTTGKQMNVFFIYTGRELAEFTLLKTATASVIQKLLANETRNK